MRPGLLPFPRLILCLLPALLLAGAPAVATAGEPGTALVVDRTTHDFGVVRQWERRETTFTYRNAGSRTLKGIGAKADCGCNAVSVSKKELAPGESGVLSVDFRSSGMAGAMTKRIRLFCEGPDAALVEIHLSIAIIEGVILWPPGLNFGNVPLGTTPSRSFQVKWHAEHGTPFEIQSVRIPGHDLRTKVTPWTDPRDPKWRGWNVEVAFKESPPVGMFSAKIEVRTTAAERPLIELPLNSNVCGKVWIQARSMSFGVVTAGTVGKARLLFRPFGEGVSFGRVQAKARAGLVKVSVAPDPKARIPGTWILTGTLPVSTPVGTLSEEQILLDVGIAGEPPVKIEVHAIVRSPRRSGTRGGR